MNSSSLLGRIVLVEGNISAGKSTIARNLGDELKFRTFFEPTVSNPYLERFYQDPPKYALRMQIWLLKQRYNTYLQAIKHTYETGEGVILDRSVFSDWVFAAKNLADGNIDEAGYAYYESLRKQMLDDLPLPDTVLFLDVSAPECHRRIVDVRKRSCESAIPLDYLQGLDDCYQQWLEHMGDNGHTKVYTVAWENFGETGPITQRLKSAVSLSTPSPSLSVRTKNLIYNEAERKRAQVLEHDLWSEDEHEDAEYDDEAELRAVDSQSARSAMSFDSNASGSQNSSLNLGSSDDDDVNNF